MFYWLCQKNFRLACIQTFIDQLAQFQTGYDDRYYWALHCDTSHQGHRSARKQKHLCQLSHKVCNRFKLNLLYCWGLVWWSSCSFYLVQSLFNGENGINVILYKKNNLNVGLCPDICGLISLSGEWGIMWVCSPLLLSFHLELSLWWWVSGRRWESGRRTHELLTASFSRLWPQF